MALQFSEFLDYHRESSICGTLKHSTTYTLIYSAFFFFLAEIKGNVYLG